MKHAESSWSCAFSYCCMIIIFNPIPSIIITKAMARDVIMLHCMAIIVCWNYLGSNRKNETTVNQEEKDFYEGKVFSFELFFFFLSFHSEKTAWEERKLKEILNFPIVYLLNISANKASNRIAFALHHHHHHRSHLSVWFNGIES